MGDKNYELGPGSFYIVNEDGSTGPLVEIGEVKEIEMVEVEESITCGICGKQYVVLRSPLTETTPIMCVDCFKQILNEMIERAKMEIEND